VSGHGLSDQLAIRALVDRYAFAVDERRPAEMAELFVDDGAVEIYLEGRESPVARLSGVRQFASVTDALRVYRGTMHVVSNCLVTVAGDDARGRAYCVAHHWYAEGGDSRDEALLLRYEDRFVRTTDGWRFALREIRRRWTSRQPAGQIPLEVDLAIAGRRRPT
jgi:hypothetical protein